MPRLNRSAVTLEVGESLRDLARRLSKLDDFSGDARLRELTQIRNSLPPLSARLQQVITNCRSAGGSYPNYPAVRKAITEGGDRVYEQKLALDAVTVTFVQAIDSDPNLDFSGFIQEFGKVGQELKLIQFAPPFASDTPANSLNA
jgi:hypothetical protein